MYGIVNTLVGYFAASVGLRLDVDHPFIRLLLTFFFYGFHQVFYWVLARALLGQQGALNIPQILMLGLLNAIIGTALFHFLDRLRERA
jgi:rod shape-determining protein MreD